MPMPMPMPKPKYENQLAPLVGELSRHAHFMLAILVGLVVAIMVLPIPPILLDWLIAFNIACSALMIMLSLYVPRSLGISTFPSLIVLTTVFRLSLNIASTKQILLHAHAGAIIETFGRLVMGGSVVVGLVIFAVISVVQFIVLSKGAERVAEVGARFSLDALPGKQMAIDADLRGGFINKHEARYQRQLLSQESHMHGSMDGALKFVKGDAIASILIALVNIIGGIIIGTGKGMDIGAAVARYTLLSVGDGMVSQIPSLLTAIAAGILITRVVAPEDRSPTLASQIGREVIEQPMALLASGAIMWGLLLVPGFPKLPFVALGVICSILGWRAWLAQRATPNLDQKFFKAGESLVNENKSIQADDSIIIAPLLLSLASSFRDRISPGILHAALDDESAKLQKELGVYFPKLQIRFDSSLPVGNYSIEVQEIPVMPSTPLLESNTSSSPESASPVSAEVILARMLASVVRMRPDAFVGTQEISYYISKAKDHLPDLHEEVMRTMPMQRVVDVIRRLALEGVSLRYLREIYESLITWAAREKDTSMLCEYVRVDLGKFICNRFLDKDRCLHAFTLDPATESYLRSAIQQGASGAYLALPPDSLRQLSDSFASRIASVSPGSEIVLVTTIETRRFLRRILAHRLPQLAIFSYNELPIDVQIIQVGRVSLPKSISSSTSGIN